MAWNPETYNKFKSDRFAPFFDLAALARIKQDMDVIDLGCGTGELTRKLADMLPGSHTLGIDASQEMLNNSKDFLGENLRFECRTIEEQVNVNTKWDLVFSNAAIQWVENHQVLLPKVIATIKTGGQLLVQVPDQHHNITNIILNDLANEEPFKEILQDRIKMSPVLDIDHYAQILFENGSKTMTVFEKIYPLVLQDSNALVDWVSGTALIPYMENLQDDSKLAFMNEFKKRLRSRFPGKPVFFPFKRIIMEASF